MNMLEKTTRMNFLFDFYHSLLTPKQKQYMSLYYLDDLSLGEIAEQADVTRQAVFDNIKRTEVLLEHYEEKLALFEKFQQRRNYLKKLSELVNDDLHQFEEVAKIISHLEKLN